MRKIPITESAYARSFQFSGLLLYLLLALVTCSAKDVAFSPFSPSSRQPPFPCFHLVPRSLRREIFFAPCCLPEKTVPIVGAIIPGILHTMLACVDIEIHLTPLCVSHRHEITHMRSLTQCQLLQDHASHLISSHLSMPLE